MIQDEKMRDIIFFMEPSLQPRMTPLKIGKMYLNRFTIDEDAAYELSGVFDMKPSGENFHRCKSDLEMDFRKDPSDITTIDTCIQKTGENAIFFYAGDSYYMSGESQGILIVSGRLRNIFGRSMIKHKVKTATLIILSMWRIQLATQEEVKYHPSDNSFSINPSIIRYPGHVRCHRYMDKSVHDDLDDLFESFELGKKYEDDYGTFCFQKLTEEEMTLLENKDKSYLNTFARPNPDIEEDEMKESKSESKFVLNECERTTIRLNVTDYLN